MRYILDQYGNPIRPSKSTTLRPIDPMEKLEELMVLFDENNLPRVDPAKLREVSDGNYSFEVNCQQDGIIIYCLHRSGNFSAWFGKDGADSGGIALSKIADILKLHIAFQTAEPLQAVSEFRENMYDR